MPQDENSEKMTGCLLTCPPQDKMDSQKKAEMRPPAACASAMAALAADRPSKFVPLQAAGFFLLWSAKHCLAASTQIRSKVLLKYST